LGDKVYVTEPLSSQKIIELLEKYPNLKKINCPKSLYLRTSKKYIDALSQLGVEVEPLTRRGRSKKYTESDVENIGKMLKKGASPQEISDSLNIPLKTVYYLNKSRLGRGRKLKYGKEREIEVKSLYKNGLPAKEISKKFKIPLRTVYSIIKR
jgi:hypothetical protein